MNMGTIVERADNQRRRLAAGFKWQLYHVHAINVITKDDFATHYSNRAKEVRDHHEKWEEDMKNYVNRRSKNLGLWVGGVIGQLIEEPNEAKVGEVLIWESQDAAFIFSIWGYIYGPVKEGEWRESHSPLFGFWPWDVKYFNGVPAVVDAKNLTLREQGLIHA
jgi:hypothetical protein